MQQESFLKCQKSILQNPALSCILSVLQVISKTHSVKTKTCAIRKMIGNWRRFFEYIADLYSKEEESRPEGTWRGGGLETIPLSFSHFQLYFIHLLSFMYACVP